MPGLTFVKGYLRAYASGIGLIPEEVVLRFEDYLGRLSGESRQFKKPAKKSLPWLSISFVFLTVLVLIYILWIR
jgi:cytoskeletal protein RodZ